MWSIARQGCCTSHCPFGSAKAASQLDKFVTLGSVCYCSAMFLLGGLIGVFTYVFGFESRRLHSILILSWATTARAGNLTGTLTQPVFNESARC